MGVPSCILIVPPEEKSVIDKEMGQEGIFPPLGLAYLASVLRSSGIKVKIIDSLACSLSGGDVCEIVENEKPDFCGITVLSQQIGAALKLTAKIKEVSPLTKTVLGGPHIHFEHESVITEPNVDYCVRGEGEQTLLELIQVVVEGRDLRTVKGVTFKDDAGQVIANPGRPYLQNLDEIPFPARDLLPMEAYNPPIALGTDKPFTSILATRGCPYKCHYCCLSAMWGTQRRRSVENVLAEIEQCVKNMGIKRLSFVDDLLVVNNKWAIELFRGMCERGIDVEWDCTGRIGVMSDELLAEMKKANCQCVIYGIEFGSQRMLDFVERRYTIDQIHDTIRRTNKAKIPVKGLFMMGYPTETRETLEETIQLANKLKLDYVAVSMVAPYPGTKLYQYCVEHDILHDIGQEGRDLLQLRYRAINLEHLSLDDLIHYHKKFYSEFMLRPSYALRMMRLHPREALTFGPRFLKWLLLGKR